MPRAKKLVNKFAYDRTHPVAVAVEPQKQDAIAQAKKWATEYTEKAKQKLVESGWDLNIAAPYPTEADRAGWGIAAMVKNETRSDFASFTKDVEKPMYFDREKPRIVKWYQPGADAYIEKQMQRAADTYDAFVYKLVNKIGPCKTATLEGNHVWGFSILDVRKGEGVAEIKELWKTQQIDNYSKFNKRFAQWPSRLMKPGSK